MFLSSLLHTSCKESTPLARAWLDQEAVKTEKKHHSKLHVSKMFQIHENRKVLFLQLLFDAIQSVIMFS